MPKAYLQVLSRTKCLHEKLLTNKGEIPRQDEEAGRKAMSVCVSLP